MEAESFPVDEGNKRFVVRRDEQSPPGSWNTSCAEGHLRDTGGPSGASVQLALGAWREGQPERHAEPSLGVGPTHTTDEAIEGNEMVEGRGRLGRISLQEGQGRTQRRGTLLTSLQRVNEAAKRDKRARFSALLHHIDVQALWRAFLRLKRNVSAGIDGQTVQIYETELEANLQILCAKVHRGSYRALPVRRVYIPKADGGERPLGVPALEDKILQSAIAELLGAIYEVDFLGFSYGFRPGRSPHQALEALHTALMSQRVNWVLDADIRKFFDSVSHEWLVRMLAHRIADRRVLRLIEMWLKAGVLEDGAITETTLGTPQGSSISPILANVFLHYVFDLWVHRWRQRQAHGRVIVVRYCDDFVMGFQFARDARTLLAELHARFEKFSLRLHEAKTRLIEFGRMPALDRRTRGQRRPATFAFLGFTHYCGWTRDGRFVVKRRTQSKRLTAKLKALRIEAKRRMHAPLIEQHRWLCQVLRGHFAYFGLPSNFPSLYVFSQEVRTLWYRSLRRRSQRQLTWAGYARILTRLPLPTPHLLVRHALAHG